MSADAISERSASSLAAALSLEAIKIMIYFHMFTCNGALCPELSYSFSLSLLSFCFVCVCGAFGRHLACGIIFICLYLLPDLDNPSNKVGAIMSLILLL